MLVMYGARKSLEPPRRLTGSLVTTLRSGRIERGEWLSDNGPLRCWASPRPLPGKGSGGISGCRRLGD